MLQTVKGWIRTNHPPATTAKSVNDVSLSEIADHDPGSDHVR